MDTPSQPYKFLYDGKKYPKIAAELPVYRRAGVLMNEEVVAKNMGNLKFGTLSLKNLPEMNIDALILQVKDADTYSLHIDIREGTIALVNNSLYELSEASDASESSAKVYDPKGLSKKIEKKLKGLGISLAGYGNIQIEHRLEENAVDFLSPFLLNGYTVWSPKNDQQLGVRGVYNPETDQISLSNIDIAKYEYATYSTRSQEEVMASLPTG
ncbi:MAG: hypothetical protein LBO09_01610 [Candidatus Peribacteria bacterium]|nr:hypothetical protein [Candidatus Peribacteria bacterium]